MSKQTQTDRTIGTMATDTKTDTIVEIVGHKAGWVVVQFPDGTTKNRRAGDLADVEKEKRTQAATLAHYRKGYRVSISGSGRKSQASELSAVATEWEGHDHGKVAQWAAILLGQTPLALYTKYSHLNNGQMRMNSGNQINARVKKGEISQEEMRAVMQSEIESTLVLDTANRPDRIAK
jgi:hypothetical protein